MTKYFRLAGAALAVAVLAAGCIQGPSAADPQVADQRAKFLLASEPPGAVGVLDAREALGGQDELVVVGRIGGVGDPWTRGAAAFVIADPVVFIDADGHQDCADACAFCSKDKDDATGRALVQFVDDQGQVLPIDARKLFGLTARQTVVVRGQPNLDGLGNLILTATGLYIRQ